MTWASHVNCDKGVEPPDAPDCAHRNHPWPEVERECAEQGCGFCRAAQHRLALVRYNHWERLVWSTLPWYRRVVCRLLGRRPW